MPQEKSTVHRPLRSDCGWPRGSGVGARRPPRAGRLPHLPRRRQHDRRGGHSIAVDGQKFSSSIHGSLQCANCHADIKGYPHPDKIAPVDCKTCHADQADQLKGSVHADSKDHPCTSCHGDAHEIYPKTDARSAVYPLNVPKTCGQCHSNNGMAGKHGLASVYPQLHRLDSRLRAQQGRPAGRGQLPKLPRLAQASSATPIRRARPTSPTSPRPAAPATPRSTPTTSTAFTARRSPPAK